MKKDYLLEMNVLGGKCAYATMEDLNKLLNQQRENLKTNNMPKTIENINTEKKPTENIYQEYVGKSFEVPLGKAKIVSAEAGSKPNNVLIEVEGLDSDGKKVYQEKKELPINALKILIDIGL